RSVWCVDRVAALCGELHRGPARGAPILVRCKPNPRPGRPSPGRAALKRRVLRTAVRRTMAIVTGACVGVAGGFLLTDGDAIGLAIAISGVATAMAASYFIVPKGARSVVLPIVLLAILIRVAAAVVLYEALLAAGRGGFVTGDDAGYANLSTRL